jgi:hypothetical protein
VSTETLLETKTVGKKKDVFSAVSSLPFGTYWHPGSDVRPCVDRAFVARHPDGKRRLVLIQDKINAAGFADAVTALNRGEAIARARRSCAVYCKYQHTRKQKDFDFPYILISDNEVAEFYTVNFAPAIRFLRKRHEQRDEGSA